MRTGWVAEPAAKYDARLPKTLASVYIDPAREDMESEPKRLRCEDEISRQER